ncbi:MAG: hypothetical protein O2816_00840 [Planctomycetota bacterium]|nr:hypothetical protein [Planctomycetota bacterium]
MLHLAPRTVSTVLLLAILPAGSVLHAQDPTPAPPESAPLDEFQRARERFESLVAEQDAILAERLWEVSDWCRHRKLYTERDRLARTVIEIDPDHQGARKVLKFFKRGDEWVQSGSYRQPRSHARDEHLEEFRQRLAQATDPYKLQLFRRLEREGDLLVPGTRERVLAKLLVLDPNDVALRTVLGEEAHGGRWVLSETKRALEAGRGVQTKAVESLEQVDRPQLSTTSKPEREVPVRWNATRMTPGVRVVGTTPSSEVEETARVTEAVSHLFKSVFGDAQAHRRGYTIYLLQNQGEREALLNNLGAIGEPTKGDLRRAGGGWLGAPNTLGEWDANPARRLDGAARQTLGAMMMDAYGINGSDGWAWEGLGLYLVYHMTGTRMTYFFDPQRYSTNRATTIWPLLQAQETQWLAVARDQIGQQGFPSLEFLLGRSVDTMRDEDLLLSYALAAYLLEGRPDDVPRILRRVGAGEHPVTVFEDVTGFAMPDLERRLQRWLQEILP